MAIKDNMDVVRRFQLFPKKQTEVNNSQALPEPARAWSWAGFGLSWIYFAGMYAPPEATAYTLIGLIMANFATKYSDPLLVFTGGALALAIQVYSAVKGREIAYSSRKWDSIQEFEDNQKIWDRWGIGFFVIFSITKTVLTLLAQR